MKLGTADIFLIHERRVLMLLRDEIPEISDQGCWSLPGGHLEPDETFEDGLRREVLEEVGLQFGDMRCLGQAVGPDGRVHRKYYAVLTGVEVESLVLGDEGQEFRFFGLEEIDAIPLSKELGRIRYEHADGFVQLFEENPDPEPSELGLEPCS